jgi:glycosyltransferase involved in cell wall biosynthesis
MWTYIKKEVKDATLHVFYDMDRWLATVEDLRLGGHFVNTSERADVIKQLRLAMKSWDSGVSFHGGIGQWQLAREQLASELMVYPCDPVRPTEGFSMSCLEGISAGCSLITSDADALPELWSAAPDVRILPTPKDDGSLDDPWIAAIIEALTTTKHRAAKMQEKFIWRAVAKQWEQECSQSLLPL